MRNQVRRKSILMLMGALGTLLLGGCGAVKERRSLVIPPAYAEAKTATPEEVLSLIDQRYSGIGTLTVSRFEVEFTGGAVEDGYLEKYRKAKGYLVAANPDSAFVNILNPLTNSSVLVMAAEKGSFQVWIPSRNQYVIGHTDLIAHEDNPIYNVRPAHILQAILIEPLPSGAEARFSFEEAQDDTRKYYVLGVFELAEDSPIMRLRRKIWIERSQMVLARQQYYSGPQLLSSIEYGMPVEVAGKLVSTSVKLERPLERYSIAFQFDPASVQLNREIKDGAFKIDQPPGAEVVNVNERRQGGK